MFALLAKPLLILRSYLRSRARLQAENLALRQQVLILSRKNRSRVRLRNLDRLVLVWLFRIFPSILSAIIVVKPETVIRWQPAWLPSLLALEVPSRRSPHDWPRD
jgi:hypothetical protein